MRESEEREKREGGIVLGPMSPEKEELLALACRQWNTHLYAGMLSRRKYFRDNQKATWNRWKYLSRQARVGILARLLPGRKITRDLAAHAVTKGLWDDYPYRPRNSFMLPEAAMTVSEGALWLSLFPFTQLGFHWQGGHPGPAVIFKKGNSWRLKRLRA